MDLEVVISFLRSNYRPVLLCTAVFLATLKWIRSPRNLPPGPMPLPVLGNSAKFWKRKNYEVICELAEKYGGVFTMYLGGLRVIVISDINIAKEAAIKQADIFSNRFLPPVLVWTIGDNGSLFFKNGHEWKERRKFVMHALRNFGVGKKSLEYGINEEARCMVEVFEEKKGEPFDPSVFVGYMIANVICRINFGKRYDYQDKEFQTIIQDFQSIFRSFTLTGLVQVFPWLVRTPVYGFIFKTINKMKTFISGILKEHQDTLDENDTRDIIDMYLVEIKRQQESGEEVLFKPEQAWRAILEIFGGGTDTTLNTLLFGILLTTLNPEIQDKVQEEIDLVVGTDRQPSCEDRPNMPYVDALIMEIQRFRPVIVLSPPRGVFQDTTLAGYNIPKGTQVLFNLWGMLHDPKVWKNPNNFDPTNFLSDDGKTVIRPEQFIPFGLGRRVCLGENLARMELFLFYTNLFQRFRFSFPEGDPVPSLEPRIGIVANPENFRICATPR